MYTHIITHTLWLAAAVVCPTLSVQAQTTMRESTVRGVLQDSTTHEAIDYATVRLVPQDSTLHTEGVLTEEGGHFALKAPKPGQYLLQIASVGKKTVMREIHIAQEGIMLNLDTIYTTNDTTALGELEVRGVKPLVRVQPDRLSYDVQSDQGSAAKTVLEMLRKVPLVQVDGQDNITVRGSANFKVYVNGKLNPNMTARAKEIFRSMPASMVKNIEVITDVGAKYEAEGTVAVLNLVMEKTELPGGYTATISATAGTTYQSGNVYATVQSGKWAFNTYYTHTYNRFFPQRFEVLRKDYTSTTGHELRAHIERDDARYFIPYGGMNASYELSKNDLLTAEANLFGLRSNGYMRSQQEMYAADGSKTYEVGTNTHTRNRGLNTYVGIDYQHTFGAQGNMLTLSYKLTDDADKTKSDYSYTGYSEFAAMQHDYRQDNRTRFSEHSVQADYVHPFSTHHYMDAGVRYIDRSNRSDAQTWYTDGAADMPDAANTGNYRNTYRIVAAYSDYRYTLGHFSARAGLRYEHSMMNAGYKEHKERDFSRQYRNIVPSLTLTYTPTTTSNLQLAYNMRIQRPSIEMLNPFLTNNEATTHEYGNPNLVPEKSNTVSLSYSLFGARMSGSLTASYTRTDNAIEQYTFMQNGVANMTYGNVVRARHTNLQFWGSYTPWQNTRITLSGDATYKDLRSTQLNNHIAGWQYQLYAGVNQQLGRTFTAEAFAVYVLPQFTMNMQTTALWVYGGTLTGKFLKDQRLTVALQMQNPLRNRERVDVYQRAADFNSLHKGSIVIRSLSLRVSFRLGADGKDVKKARRTISNDDIKQATNGLGNMGGGNQ